jgi:hypothetical protein
VVSHLLVIVAVTTKVPNANFDSAKLLLIKKKQRNNGNIRKIDFFFVNWIVGLTINVAIVRFVPIMKVIMDN